MKPVGAITRDRFAELAKENKPIWFVMGGYMSKLDRNFMGGYMSKLDRNFTPEKILSAEKWWFNEAGKKCNFLFENYFHAYAYCLKVNRK